MMIRTFALANTTVDVGRQQFHRHILNTYRSHGVEYNILYNKRRFGRNLALQEYMVNIYGPIFAMHEALKAMKYPFGKMVSLSLTHKPKILMFLVKVKIQQQTE